MNCPLWVGEISLQLGVRVGCELRGILDKADQVADRVVPMSRVAEREFVVDCVGVAASVARRREIAGLLEVVDDLHCGSFGDADGGGDVS